MANDDLNPQHAEMADASMVTNLSAQAKAIWPQEAPLFERYGLPARARILDAGCGTGEITLRLARLFPDAELLGVDVLPSHLRHARVLAKPLGARVSFEERSVYDLGLAEASFDLVVCRHVLQAVPHAERVLAELRRVLRPGGTLHLLVEDYGMLNFEARACDPNAFWWTVAPRYGAALGIDMYIGRDAYGMLQRLGFDGTTVDYVVVDPLRVPRETMATIYEAWRDGYTESIALHTGMPASEVRSHFNDMIATIRSPDGYAVWHVPIVAGRRSAADGR